MIPIALSTIMPGSGDYSFIKDRHSRYLGCSRAVLDMNGLKSEDDIRGKTDYDLFGRELADRFFENDRQVLERGVPVLDFVAELPQKAGGSRLFSTSVYPIPDASGQVIGLYGVSRDVGKEQDLLFELNVLLNTIPSGVLKYAADESEGFAYVSRNFIENLGYTEESFKTKFHNCFREMVYEEDRDAAEAEVLRQESGGQIGRFDYRIEAADGQLRWFHDEGVRITDQAGKSWYYVTLVDITESREAYARLKLMTDSTPSGLATYACTPQGIQISYCNNGFCELFGTSRDRFMQIPSADPLRYVLEGDRGKLMEQYARLLLDGTPLDCTYRIMQKDGSLKWVHQRAVVSDRHGETTHLNSALFDITEQQMAAEKLRMREEENRLAIKHSGRIVTRFDVEKRTLTLPESITPIFEVTHILENMPEEQIALGRVSPETAEQYRHLFNSIADGSASGAVTFQQNSTMGWRWLEAQYTTVFSDTGKPVSAVITFTDITEQLEKELVYNKWQQSLANRPSDSYTLFRCNLSKNSAFESCEGTLVDARFSRGRHSFSELTAEYAKRVFPEDRSRYLAFMDSDAMLAGYYRGRRSDTLEYRELGKNGAVRWLCLSVDLVEYPNSRDVEVYLMYEDVTASKEAQLLAKEQAETDPLTGILNRTAFAEQMKQIIKKSGAGEKHALLMADIDGFKSVNDVYGHDAGDRVLRELAGRMRSILRRDDLLCRLGGDEFFIFLKGVPGEAVAAMKARQLCGLGVQIPDSGECITVSVGVAMLPQDGTEYDALYKKVDAALYRQKKAGKNGYQFVSA